MQDQMIRLSFKLVFPLLALTVMAGTVSLSTGQTSNKVAAKSSSNAAGKHIYMWCWASQLGYDNTKTLKTYYSQVFQVHPGTANATVNAAFGNWVQKIYNTDFQATGIGPGVCSAFGSFSEADASRHLSRDNQNETGPTMHPPVNTPAVLTPWSYETSIWQCGGVSGMSLDTELTLSLHPDGTPEAAGLSTFDFYIPLAFSKGSTQINTWYRQPDGTIVVSIPAINGGVKTFFLRLGAGGKLSGYLRSSKSADEQVPISCASLTPRNTSYWNAWSKAND